MSQPQTSPAAPRWLNHVLLTMVALVLGAIMLTALLVDAAFGGWSITPSPLWSAGITLVAFFALAAVGAHLARWMFLVGEHRKRQTDRDLTLILNALLHAGFEMPDAMSLDTNDVGRTIILGYREAATNGNGHKAVDPDVIRAANRLQGRVLPFNDR